ncbi:MAG TPA: phosphoenolpyruvate--protein phosphotransferase [Actinomycetota bacterium]|nr:phosphoenolpyruvate--protein phosphotransferase [Actinomycetota bacterium]
MIGIVLVSHSAKLAEGVAELARQMGGEDVPLEPVGGLDLPDRPIGTDAVLVSSAIERAWSKDGVLVLMDLGSAVLSAEMAVEMLPEDRRERVLLCAAPFVEGAVAAAVAARLGRSLEEVAEEARNGLSPKAAHLGVVPPGEVSEAVGAAEPGPVAAARTVRLRVENPLGLHARPAARLVRTAGAFDADVRVRNLTTGRGPASARSLNAIATLGVLRGHEIEISASGTQAGEALRAIEELAAERFGDEVVEAAPPPPGREAPAPPVEGAFAGHPASPGVVVAPARHTQAPEIEVPTEPVGEPEREWEALEAALEATARDIRATRAQVAARAGEQAAAIFDAHALLLEDEDLLSSLRRAILSEGRGAAAAWFETIERVAAAWRALDDPYLQARAADVQAVGRQVLAHLTGRAAGPLVVTGEGVVVAEDLTPADTAGLDPAKVRGIATALGGPTSHSAVLARSLGIPAVVGLGRAILEIPEGTTVLLDGDAGLLRPNPDADMVAEAERRAEAFRASEAAARAEAERPASTRDGVRIEVLANIGGPEDVGPALDAGAEGVGLLRTEFVFLGRDTMPTEDEQEAVYRDIATRLGGRPLVLRTLDVGGDKPLPYVPMAPEANPFLGLRGLRLGLSRPDVLLPQLRAAIRVAADHPLRVMFPMVTTLEEVRAARELVERTRRELAAGGRGAPEHVEVGIMVEVPSAALNAAALAAEVDFFSIGTNDLAQYTLAAERGNEQVAGLADALHPSVLRLIRMTVEAADPLGRGVAVCGELAADEAAVAILVGLGVRELSASAPAIPRVKRAVRALTLGDARALAERALGCRTAAEVRRLVTTARPAVSID